MKEADLSAAIYEALEMGEMVLVRELAARFNTTQAAVREAVESHEGLDLIVGRNVGGSAVSYRQTDYLVEKYQ